MDDHPPRWEGNGMPYLKPFGLTSDRIVRINVYLPRATVDAPPPPIDCIELAKGLVENYSLTSIELHRCDIDEDGVAAVAQALAVNKYLTEVGLSRNRFGNSGGVLIAESLKINQTVKSIDLSWNELRDSTAASIAEALFMNNSLQHLILDRNHITDDGVGALVSTFDVNTKLKYLGLSRNKIKASGCSFVGRALDKCKTLLVLDLSMNAISQEGIFSLCRSLVAAAHFTALQTLNLAYNKVESSAVVLGSFLQSTKTLRELNLECTFLQPGTELDQFCRSLAANTTLCNVSFAANALTDAGIKTICDAVSTAAAPPLRYVDFTDVQATAASIPSIAQLVLQCKQLSTLHISQNANMGREVESGAAIGDMLGASDSLRFLGATHVGFTRASVMSFAESLRRRSPSITGLSLRGNSMGDEGWAKLVQSWLFHYPKLEYIDVSGNGLTLSKALDRVNDVFGNNQKLRYIVFEDDFVLTEANMYQAHELIKGAKIDGKLPVPPLTHAPYEINVSFVPTEGFSTYSVTTGSVMKRQVESTDCLSLTLFQFAGKPVKGWRVFEGTKTGVTGKLSSENQHYWAYPTIEETAAMENNIGGLLISDDQMRREFNRLDVEGCGYLDAKTFKNVYRSFEHFGVEMTDRQIDRLLAENSNEGRINFDSFCVLILKLAQH